MHDIRDSKLFIADTITTTTLDIMSSARMKALMLQRQDASALNHKLAREEAAEIQQDPQTEAYLDRRRKRAEAKLARMDRKREMQDPSSANDTVRKTYTLAEIEQWEARQEERRERQNRGLFDHASMALRQYERLTARLDPQAVMARQGDMEKGVQALKKEVEEEDRLTGKRRRRRVDEEDGLVTFVNEHNARFNAMAAKAYDSYVSEIRDSLQ